VGLGGWGVWVHVWVGRSSSSSNAAAAEGPVSGVGVCGWGGAAAAAAAADSGGLSNSQINSRQGLPELDSNSKINSQTPSRTKIESSINSKNVWSVNLIYTYMYGVYTIFYAGTSSNIRSYTVCRYIRLWPTPVNVCVYVCMCVCVYMFVCVGKVCAGSLESPAAKIGASVGVSAGVGGVGEGQNWMWGREWVGVEGGGYVCVCV